MTKILVSEGFGAGWATWNDKSKEVAEYEPIIKFIEDGGDPSDLDTNSYRISGDDKETYHPLVAQMLVDLDLGDYFYTGGAGGLTVVEVDGAYRIDEYDGYESVKTAADMW